LIDAHGGKIHVQSAGKDKGATFSVELNTVLTPLGHDGDGQDQQMDREPKPAVPKHRRVLVVDDHHDTCIGMKRMLERHGYEITLAHSAEQAVEKVRTQDFDLLISDIGLPDRSGYELMREVRLKKDLPGIALSGFGSEQDISQAREAGFSEHLTKPINFERLEKTIQTLLS
jgi:CheY-like chemotaxis protein